MAHQFLHCIVLHGKQKQRKILGAEQEVKLFKQFLKSRSLSLRVSELVIIVKKQTNPVFVGHLSHLTNQSNVRGLKKIA